jgi:hypothetical protein
MADQRLHIGIQLCMSSPKAISENTLPRASPMGNTIPTDRRFDKPALESVVDLINTSNKTYIKYGEIEVVRVLPIEGRADELYNSTIDICLADAGEDAPVVRMTYGRLEIGDYLSQPRIFQYSGLEDVDTLLPQLQLLHYIELAEEDCMVDVDVIDEDGLYAITFTPKADHMVWTGQLLVWGAPEGHIGAEIPMTFLSGFTLQQLLIEAGGS